MLNRNFLLEIGGWRTLQEGRILFESAKVLSWKHEDQILTGVVQSGTSTVNARLKIGKRLSDVENLCSCRQAREYGTICPHVIAIGLAAIAGTSPRSEAEIGAPPRAATPKAKKADPIQTISASDREPNSKHLELSVLLPVNLATSWRENRGLRIILEGTIDAGKPVPLDAIPRNGSEPYSAYCWDVELLRILQKCCNGETPGLFILPLENTTEFFQCLLGHPHVMLGKKSKLEVRVASEPAHLGVDLFPDGEIRLKLDARMHMQGDYLSAPGSLWRFSEGYLDLLAELPPAYRLLRERDVILPRSAVGQFFQNDLPVLEKQIRINFGEGTKNLRFEQVPPRIRATFDGMLAGINCKIEALYGSTAHPLRGFPQTTPPTTSQWIPDPTDPLRYFQRNLSAEQTAQNELLHYGFQPGQRNTELYTLTSENKVGFFLANVLPRLRTKWEVVFSSRMGDFLGRCDFIETELTIQSSGTDWLAMDMSYHSNDGSVKLSHSEIMTMLEKNSAYHRGANGRYLLLPTESISQFQSMLKDCQVQQDRAGFQFNRRHEAYIAGMLQAEKWKLSKKSSWQPPTELSVFEDLTLGDHLDDVLRPYQKTGVSWIHFLFKNKLGGILADEMGLGKTLQTLSYIDYRKQHKLSTKPTLIVGPTSLVKNWLLEAEKFTPKLKTIALTGANRRTLFYDVQKHDLAVTSYSLLRRDVEELQKLEFDIVILDEAQNIKNRASQNAQAAKALTSSHRLVLTGTPIENSLFDLWSIFDFLMPHYLGSHSEFKEDYESRIAKLNDAQALERLRQRIRPFVLRRTKAEVARDLPPKIEHMAKCDLTEEQRTVYQALLEQGRREVHGQFGKKAGAQERLAILTILTRLRQACCHLEMLPQTESRTWNDPSAKMNYFVELLDEAVDGGHRVLVFSQFVTLLKLVAKQLDYMDMDFCYLDGATLDRQAEVDRFQQNPGIPVFLISLKAGGTGLNLTGADVVIHFDPWWNPAVEDQATARAHRMGQSRIVNSYKLIARGTVEEKIVDLQNRKKDLIASTMLSEETFVHSLSMDELKSLLE